MSKVSLQRTTFSTSRAAEYFDARELSAQTGQSQYNFAHVAIKELVDNALDACETAGVAPVVSPLTCELLSRTTAPEFRPRL